MAQPPSILFLYLCGGIVFVIILFGIILNLRSESNLNVTMTKDTIKGFCVIGLVIVIIMFIFIFKSSPSNEDPNSTSSSLKLF